MQNSKVSRTCVFKVKRLHKVPTTCVLCLASSVQHNLMPPSRLCGHRIQWRFWPRLGSHPWWQALGLQGIRQTICPKKTQIWNIFWGSRRKLLGKPQKWLDYWWHSWKNTRLQNAKRWVSRNPAQIRWLPLVGAILILPFLPLPHGCFRKQGFAAEKVDWQIVLDMRQVPLGGKFVRWPWLLEPLGLLERNLLPARWFVKGSRVKCQWLCWMVLSRGWARRWLWGGKFVSRNIIQVPGGLLEPLGLLQKFGCTFMCCTWSSRSPLKRLKKTWNT